MNLFMRKYDRRNFLRKMESSGFLIKKEVNDGQAVAWRLDVQADIPIQRALYVYSFDEEAFAKANASKEWRKYPFDF